MSDMPTQLPDTCELAAVPPRDDPRDALVVKKGLPYTSLASLPEGAVVGTSSLRRMAQLHRRYPHLKFASLRGNVETRLRKVDDPESEYTCMVISAAGLARIGRPDRIAQYLGTKNGGIMHAVGQGALGLEIRKGDERMLALLNRLVDEKSTLACLAERALLRTLEGGCSVPIGVETEWLQGAAEPILKMDACVVSIDGSQNVEAQLERSVRTTAEAETFGKELAERLMKAGAGEILKAIKQDRPMKE